MLHFSFILSIGSGNCIDTNLRYWRAFVIGLNSVTCKVIRRTATVNAKSEAAAQTQTRSILANVEGGIAPTRRA